MTAICLEYAKFLTKITPRVLINVIPIKKMLGGLYCDV